MRSNTVFAMTSLAVAAALALAISGCNNHSTAIPRAPVMIVKGDVCATCGMFIHGYPGPRAEAYIEGRAAPLKFGSTRDFFAYILQPDNATQLQELYVQDSARIDWKNPSDAADSFVDAHGAFYVAWQPLGGEMGPTLASFARLGDAQSFIKQYGGELMKFDQITPALVSTLGYQCPPSATSDGATASACTIVTPPAAAKNDGDKEAAVKETPPPPEPSP